MADLSSSSSSSSEDISPLPSKHRSIMPNKENDDLEEQFAFLRLKTEHSDQNVQKLLHLIIDKIGLLRDAIMNDTQAITRLEYKIKENRKKLGKISNIKEDIEELNKKLNSLEETRIKTQTLISGFVFVLGFLASAGVFGFFF